MDERAWRGHFRLLEKTPGIFSFSDLREMASDTFISPRTVPSRSSHHLGERSEVAVEIRSRCLDGYPVTQVFRLKGDTRHQLFETREIAAQPRSRRSRLESGDPIFAKPLQCIRAVVTLTPWDARRLVQLFNGTGGRVILPLFDSPVYVGMNAG